MGLLTRWRHRRKIRAVYSKVLRDAVMAMVIYHHYTPQHRRALIREGLSGYRVVPDKVI